VLGTFWILSSLPYTWTLSAQHKTNSLPLVVDDFAVKYVGKQHIEHLRNALLRSYELTEDWEAKVYYGMTLQWDYKNRTYDNAMPGYVANVLS
jgi:hypothetical protein